MAEQLKPDFCVIGGGPGGIAFATAAAHLGRSVILVERARLGGANLTCGGIPTKAFLAAGARAQAVREASGFGLRTSEPSADMRAVTQHVFDTMAQAALNVSAERLTALGIDIITADASFIDRASLAAGGVEIRARHFIIATGSKPLVPPFPGLDRVRWMTPETVFTQDQPIDRLIVVGGSGHGLELAQGFRRLGAEVTVIEALIPLAEAEAELRGAVLARLAAEGVRIIDNARIDRFESYGTAVRAVFDRGGRPYVVEGSHVLLTLGRRPTIEGLGLEAAGVKFSANGIAVSRTMRTSHPRIHAIGDVTGAPGYAHVAAAQAGTLARRLLFRLPARHDGAGLPAITFTDPAIAHVGLTEEGARARHGTPEILRWPLAENDRALGLRQTDGYIKVVATRRGRIVGASIVGTSAEELIVPWALAMQKRLSVRAMASFITPLPALSEISGRAARLHYLPLLASPITRRVLGWLAPGR